MGYLSPEGWPGGLRSRRGYIFSVACGYLVFGLGWIFLSDRLLLAFTDISALVRLSTIKGVVFILLTTLFFFLALSDVPDKNPAKEPEQFQSVRLVLFSERLPWWVVYLLAAAATLAMLGLQMHLAIPLSNRPLMILFMLPIILSSALGGLGPGLLATALAALATDYFGIPPLYSLWIASSDDFFQWFVLVLNGVLVSCLSEMLIRARRQAEMRRIQQEIAKEELHVSEERFQLAMRGVNDGLWDWDLLTDRVYYSPRWGEMLGFAAEELDSSLETWRRLVHPDDMQRTLALVADLLEGRTDRFETEFRMCHKDGRYLDILSRAFPVSDETGRIIRLVGTHTDITQRRQAESALKEREALLDKTSRMAKVGGWGVDVRTGRETWSDEVARIHDLDPSQGGNVERGLQFYSPEHRPLLEQALKEAIEDCKPYDLELEILSAKGIRKWVRTVCNPVVQDGKVVRLEGILHDITDRKEAERELQALNAQLELRVEQRTAELTAANLELDAFAYAVSHDLRAPLRAMSGFSQALIEDYGGKVPGEALGYLEQIIIGSRRMGELIDGLLTLSRSTRSRLQWGRVDLSAMAARLLGRLAADDPARQVHWQIEPDLQACGDETMLEAVLANLLGNAWKYTSRRERAVIRFFARNDEGLQWFCIEDNGAGFDPVHAAKLFQPFQRLHRQEEFPGIGIGLATAQRIIHRHGGVIRAEGRPDQGAVFCFSLPGKNAGGPDGDCRGCELEQEETEA
jgi:PAS domain S-box-containing protein